MRRLRHRRGSGGQAMVELVIAIVCVLALLGGLLQVVTLANTHTDVIVKARQEAAELAMADLGAGGDPVSDAAYIGDWQEGSDGARYTPDDLRDYGNSAAFRNLIADKAAKDEAGWAQIDETGSRISRVHASPDPVTCFGMVKGSESKSVTVIPAVRDLLYKADSIKVQADVYMTWTKGIY